MRFGIGLSPYELYRDYTGAAKADFAAKLRALDEIGIDAHKHKPKSIEDLEEWEGLNFDLIVSLSPEADMRDPVADGGALRHIPAMGGCVWGVSHVASQSGGTARTPSKFARSWCAPLALLLLIQPACAWADAGFVHRRQQLPSG